MQFHSLGWEDPLESEVATHSSILTWETTRTEEPGRLWSKGSQRVGHDWATKQQQYTHHTHTHTHIVESIIWLYYALYRILYIKNIIHMYIYSDAILKQIILCHYFIHSVVQSPLLSYFNISFIPWSNFYWLDNYVHLLVSVEPNDTAQSKSRRRKDLFLAASKENSGDRPQSSVSLDSKIGKILS